MRISFVLMLAALQFCGGPSEKDKETLQKAKMVFGKLPEKMPGSEKDTPALIELGKKLYFE
ncbi:MAG TPA: cytochrome-c peroxidase, partial [Leptospiraceae bacterium]|nr:cytochrome-c peroxidase [Leptospiraceae bacterium]